MTAKSAAGFNRGIMDGTGRAWNDPAKFVHDAHKGFWGHNNTLSHDIV